MLFAAPYWVNGVCSGKNTNDQSDEVHLPNVLTGRLTPREIVCELDR